MPPGAQVVRYFVYWVKKFSTPSANRRQTLCTGGEQIPSAWKTS
jgi:hypothetical protein